VFKDDKASTGLGNEELAVAGGLGRIFRQSWESHFARTNFRSPNSYRPPYNLLTTCIIYTAQSAQEGLHLAEMESYTLSHFPVEVRTVHIALFHNLTNAPEIRKRLIAAATAEGPDGDKARAEVDFGFVEASTAS
jgi:hypothetical protein